MKKLILVFSITFLFLTHFAFAQNQANIWYFAENLGLDFSGGNPVLLNGGSVNSFPPHNSEGSSVICNAGGQLLFYATPEVAYNKNHQAMPNGSGLMGGLSATQGVMILPQPGSDSLFYVFTLDEFQNNLANGLRYSIVNMCLDNGLGDVASGFKNVFLADSMGEKMAATTHANGSDYWLLTRKHFTNEFYAYQISASGIAPPVISAIGWDNPQHDVLNALGQMKISPDGRKIAMGVGNQLLKIVQLFDFDNAGGMVSNMLDIPYAGNSGNPYGISFSPDNSKLYVRGPGPTGLDQFDLSSGDPTQIINSKYNIPSVSSYAGTGLQLANNNKIYVNQFNGIGVINNPNLPGAACNFSEMVFSANATYTFPSFIDNFNYKNGSASCIDTTHEETDTLIIPNVITPNGDGKNEFFPGNPGGYKFTVDIFNRWGNKIYSRTAIMEGWNGLNDEGKTCPAGVYFYLLKAESPTGEKSEFHGTVQLIR